MPHDDPTSSDAEKRARILESAFEVCERRGVAAARMEEVATRAQVSKATLYRFFESKQQLLLAALIASYDEDLRMAYENVELTADPRRVLDQILEGLVRVLETNTPSLRVFYQIWGVVAEDQASRRQLDEFMRSFHAERNRELAQLLRRGQQAGLFRAGVSPEVMAQSIDVLLDGSTLCAPASIHWCAVSWSWTPRPRRLARRGTPTSATLSELCRPTLRSTPAYRLPRRVSTWVNSGAGRSPSCCRTGRWPALRRSSRS
jgi:AcrR family transcriptional regulator